MKIVIPGGSGQVGNILAREFHARGDEVIVLSRSPEKAPWRTVEWYPHMVGRWAEVFDGADAVINLAGRSVNCRYTAENRDEIMRSRVESTRAVGEALARAKRPPRVWLQAGTATIYSHRYDAANDEATGVIGGDEDGPDTWRFSTDVAKAWEAAVYEAQTPETTRKVILRTSLVMSPGRGGVFDVMSGLVRRGLGGQMGDGRQYVSWIHERDFVRAIDWLIAHEDLDGPVILGSPNPVPNAEFMRVLREAWGVRLALPAAEWMLEIGAVFLRTETELILKSRRVAPWRLLASGFTFEYPEWKEAAADLSTRCKQSNQSARAREDVLLRSSSREVLR